MTKTIQMKDYLLLFRGDDAQLTELSEEEFAAYMQKWPAYMGDLAKQGYLVGGFPLSKEGKLMTKNGVNDVVVRSEKGETVGGYLLIKANDYNHAVELTKECPIFEHDGNVEIRETLPM